ncbi:MAG: 3-hydroxyacyl-CoA dehydrogenase family protein [SAR202 cluster bacterium]|nr:3-hydroxyacyl-CoA dehydrogenase family protein [SAR202 cluster bacterium]
MVKQIQTVAVIGAGLMGHGIALDFALSGYDVCLQTRTQESLIRCRSMVETSAKLLVDLGKTTKEKTFNINDQIQFTTNLETAASAADIVIESIYEDLDLKRSLFRELGAVSRADTVLASNTSSFLPSKLAEVTKNPERVLNVHYLNPPHIAPFVEVVPSPLTLNENTESVMSLLRVIGKKPILLKHEVEGFVASRLQAALLREALWLIENDIASANDVDMAISTGLGPRWSAAGVLKVLEFAGWDLLYRIEKELFPHLSTAADSTLLREMVDRGEIGVKSGLGFYVWTPEKAESVKRMIATELARDDHGTKS